MEIKKHHVFYISHVDRILVVTILNLYSLLLETISQNELASLTVIYLNLNLHLDAISKDSLAVNVTNT